MKILKKINKGIEYCVNNDFRFLVNAGRGKYNSMSDEEYIKKMFKAKLGYELNLENPKTFNEKLQWLKINDRNDMYTTLVDKYAVKKYVSDILGEEYIIPTLGVWDRFEDIEFDNLPEQFVLKCTHDSGGLVICKNKKELNHAKAKKIIDSSLKTNFYWHGREWPYRDVKPRLIAESYMEDEKTSELRDYKFFCFSGTVKCFKIDFDRFIDHRANYYGRDMQLLDFGEKICPPKYDKNLELPDVIEKMIDYAEMLSEGMPFLRVDFYYINGRIYFGELTFYPASGFGKFVPARGDEILGEWLQISKTNS